MTVTGSCDTMLSKGGSMSSVTVSLGFTMNTGNFESLRFDYGITDDVRSGESHNEALIRVEKIVEKRLVSRIEEEINERHK